MMKYLFFMQFCLLLNHLVYSLLDSCMIINDYQWAEHLTTSLTDDLGDDKVIGSILI